ncbi:MAG: UDP-N-acetylmuramate--L-alanine ligase [Deltaproteobacteria bacterium]|nr:UDP-N-acetylmuramate--L-alanine ligase [Deltaproteobacteria bacterium]
MTKERNNAAWRVSDLDPAKPIHLAGVAGSAMNGLALLLRQRGFRVVGTDPRADLFRESLEAAGVVVHTEQDGSTVRPDTSLVVASAALPTDHPELAAATSQGIATVTYAEFLGALMAEADGVAVAGTHGKTTTTAMVVAILRSAGLSVSFVVGGIIPGLGTGAQSGSSNIFVAEACEYNRSFLHLTPRIAVVTNIEEDHLDIYANIEEIADAFRAFASNLPESGILIHSVHCCNTAHILADICCSKISFGIETEADFTAESIRVEGGKTVFDLVCEGERFEGIRLPTPGRHNVANALAAAAVCRNLGVSFDSIIAALAGFEGVNRRFEIRGEAGGVTVVDDYAHHPTEIRALLQGASTRFPGRRLVVVFQPHQCSRTRLFLKELADSLSAADLVFVPDIYAARDSEEEKARTSSKDLVKQIAAKGTIAEYPGALDSVVERVVKVLEPEDVLLTVGAGDVDQIIDDLLKRLSS